MIHHYPIPVSETKKVASILARLFKVCLLGLDHTKTHISFGWVMILAQQLNFTPAVLK